MIKTNSTTHMAKVPLRQVN